jgi:hypothetical protein
MAGIGVGIHPTILVKRDDPASVSWTASSEDNSFKLVVTWIR